MRIPVILAALLFATPAAATFIPSNDPLVVANDAVADYDPFFDLLTVDGAVDLAFSSDGPFIELDVLTIFGSLFDPSLPAELGIFGATDPVDPLISGELVDLLAAPDSLNLRFATTNDASGRFGDTIVVTLSLPGVADPLAGFAAAPATAAVSAPVPLPASAWLLAAGVAALAARRRSAARSG
ncbi:MAG: VPLPA-CTERM sorting domain-containing protein [Pseudomonadota bacterium]